MLFLFKDKIYFTVFFFLILIVDIYIKINLEQIPYRYFSKPLILGSLFLYYISNRKVEKPSKHIIMKLALLSFLIGDILLIHYKIIGVYIFAIFIFILGKLLYTIRFSNQKDFKLIGLIPFFLACFTYMVVIMLLVMHNLKQFFVPTLIYLFACMIVALFAFLRKNAVDFRSYVMVLIGILFSVFSDSITVLQSFYNPDLPFHEISIMLFYGISQYFIVRGIVEEVAVPEKTIVS